MQPPDSDLKTLIFQVQNIPHHQKKIHLGVTHYQQVRYKYQMWSIYKEPENSVDAICGSFIFVIISTLSFLFRGSSSVRGSPHYEKYQNHYYLLIIFILIRFDLFFICQDDYANENANVNASDDGYGYESDCGCDHGHANDCILHAIGLNAEFSQCKGYIQDQKLMLEACTEAQSHIFSILFFLLLPSKAQMSQTILL